MIAAALTVFADKSPDAASIDDFIKAAGVSRGTFYNHFRTPQDLLTAVTAEISDEVLKVIDRTVLTYDDPVERITVGCLLYMHIAAENRAWGGFITRVGLQGDSKGELLDVYLSRDLDLARENNKASFLSTMAARDVILGCTIRSIQSVLLENAPQQHLRRSLEISLRGIGVPPERAQQLCAMRLPKISLSGRSDLSALLLGPAPEQD